MKWRRARAWLALVVAAAGNPAAEEPGQCTAKGGGACSGDDGGNASACAALGFDPVRLKCSTCDMLKLRVEEQGNGGQDIVQECLGCCSFKTAVVERFGSARLTADAGQQDRDQDLHDFIKRKAPMFPQLEVEYMEGAHPAVELENEDNPDRVLRAEVSGWKSEHIFEFLSSRLLSADEGEGDAKTAVSGAWTAEVQTCSGWRLNQLPEARKFIKDPGHADTYKGLKVNFIPHHNPDLVFFNEHGQEVERLDLGPYTCDGLHELMQKKGFEKKKAKIFKGEIRTCPGWRLNQLPDVRRFIKDPGNADLYMGIRINYVPHHHPYLILVDEAGKEGEWIDLTTFDFEGLQALFEQKHGFKKKELL